MDSLTKLNLTENKLNILEKPKKLVIIENDNVENDKVENDKVENDKVENDNDKVENDNDKVENDNDKVDIKPNRCSNLEERIKWAITKPPKLEKQPGLTIGTQKKEAEKAEKLWGNSIIGQTNNGQWTTLLGERLVYDILELRGESPIKVKRKGGFEPDWETDNFIYEVKTSNWWVSGTAGEKVLGTWIKYQNIQELYGKPLRIICVANQEYELEYGKIKYFGPDVSTKTKQALELARSWGIEYIRFSDLASSINILY